MQTAITPSATGATSGANRPTLDATASALRQLAEQGRLTHNAAGQLVANYVNGQVFSAISLMTRLTGSPWIPADFRLDTEAFSRRAGAHIVAAELARQSLQPDYQISAPPAGASVVSAASTSEAPARTAADRDVRVAPQPVTRPAQNPRPVLEPPMHSDASSAFMSDRDLARQIQREEARGVEANMACIDRLKAEDRRWVAQYQDEREAIVEQLSPQELELNRLYARPR